MKKFYAEINGAWYVYVDCHYYTSFIGMCCWAPKLDDMS